MKERVSPAVSRLQDSCPSDPWCHGTFSPREWTGNKDSSGPACLQGGSLFLT